MKQDNPISKELLDKMPEKVNVIYVTNYDEDDADRSVLIIRDSDTFGKKSIWRCSDYAPHGYAQGFDNTGIVKMISNVIKNYNSDNLYADIFFGEKTKHGDIFTDWDLSDVEAAIYKNKALRGYKTTKKIVRKKNKTCKFVCPEKMF